MTNTEAIKILDNLRSYDYDKIHELYQDKPMTLTDALNLAIKALQEQAEMDKFEFAEIDPHQTDMDDAWEQAKAELMQNCDQCEVGNACLYCEHEFKAKADRNEFYNWDAPIRHKADGDLISRQAVLDLAKLEPNIGCGTVIHTYDVERLPSVAIPPEHDGCEDCVYQANPQDAMPCRECKQNYMDKWKVRPAAEPSGDLISRQAAIKAIEKRAKKIKNGDTLNGLAGAVGILFELPSVKQEPKWIPVSERLPEEDGCYLVTTTGTNNNIIDIAYYTEGIWHKASKIKAWMPLPKPYEPQESEGV